MKKPVTIRDIARASGFSKSTVSMVLNGDPRIQAATAAHVRATADILGYRPELHHAARRLALMKSRHTALNRVVGLSIPEDFSSSAYFLEVFIGICDALRGTGFNLLIISVENRRPPEQLRLTLPATVQHGDIDGLILFQTIGTVGQTIITQLREEPGFAQRPIVSVLYPYDMIPAVLATEDAGAEDAAEHLLALGHRHLVHLVPMHAVSLAEARLHGVATALRRHGLDPALHLSLLYVNIPWMDAGTVMDPPEPVYTLPSQDSETSLAAFLDAHPEVTAFLGWNDACAIHLCRQLARAGIAVPERISVIGHDDTHAFPDDMGRNRLTSIRLPLRAIGERAGALLMDTLTGEAHDGVESFSFTTTLMVRQTTGPAPR